MKGEWTPLSLGKDIYMPLILKRIMTVVRMVVTGSFKFCHRYIYIKVVGLDVERTVEY